LEKRTFRSRKGSKAVGYLNEAIKLDPIGMADAQLRLGDALTTAPA
jgi:hypothetical protein